MLNSLPIAQRPAFTAPQGSATLCVFFTASAARAAFRALQQRGARVSELEAAKYGNSSFLLS
jgi:hypothetical protein